MSKRNQSNNRNHAPHGRAGRRPATRAQQSARRQDERRSDGIRLITGAIELLRLIWEIGQKLNW